MPPRPAAGRPAHRALCVALAALALDAAPAAAARPRPASSTRAHPRHASGHEAKHVAKHEGKHEDKRVSHERAERGRAERGRHGKRGKAERAHAARVVRARWRPERADADAPAPAVAAVPRVPTVPAFNLAGVTPGAAPAASLAAAPAALTLASVPAGDTLAGRSGKLRARFVTAGAAVASAASGAAHAVASYFPYLRRLLGDSAAAPNGPAADASDRRPFAFITMRPFSDKVAGRVGGYNMGFWPGELSGRGGERYRNPAGFIEVTADNQATYVSEHFRLGDFLTHDQAEVWPKYLVLHESLLDKLELVLDDLRAHGYHADRLHVMSGFRTPEYNRSGGDPAGRAELSRHQYGDAADVWVENGNGQMADLNGDGRVDARDAAVLAAAAERVELAHPELTGGVGIYHGNGAHGPFVHIDTRGARARWGRG